MSQDVAPTKNPLVGILQQIHEGDWLTIGQQKPSLSSVDALVQGFMLGQEFKDVPDLFGEVFMHWIVARYECGPFTLRGFGLIQHKFNWDDLQAYEEFFRILPEYLRDLEQVGAEGIRARARAARNKYLSQIEAKASEGRREKGE